MRPVVEFPTIQASVNGILCSCMVDSCSNISILSLNFMKANNWSFSPLNLPIIQANSVSSAIGRFQTNFTFRNFTIYPTFLVLENFNCDILVGLDIGKSFSLQPNLNTLEVLFSLPPKPYKSKFEDLFVNFTLSQLAQQFITAQPTNLTQTIQHSHLTINLSIFYLSLNIPCEQRTKETLKILYTVMKSDRHNSTHTPLSSNQQQFLQQFPSIFDSNSHLNAITDFHHSIQLRCNNPIASKPYRKSAFESQQIRDIIQDLLNKNLIRPSASPYAAPVSLVSKKDTTEKRLVIDYRRLNKVTVTDSTPLPNIPRILESAANAKVFSKLDMKSGYWQVMMAEEDI